MSTSIENFQTKYNKILRISPNLVDGKVEDDATKILKENEVTLSDSSGNLLPVSFKKCGTFNPEHNKNFIIIQTKISKEIKIDNNFNISGQLRTSELKVNTLNYKFNEDSLKILNEKQTINRFDYILGIDSTTNSFSIVNLNEKYEEIKNKYASRASGVTHNLILYHAMPFARYIFHKKRQNATEDKIVNGVTFYSKVSDDKTLYKSHHFICRDYKLCDGNDETPNLMSHEPTFIRGLNFSHNESEYISDDVIDKNNFDEKMSLLKNDTTNFKIGYAANLNEKFDINDNCYTIYPKNITDIKRLYKGTFDYLSESKEERTNHRHLLFSDYSPDSSFNDSNDESYINTEHFCIFKTDENTNEIIGNKTIYSPLFSNVIDPTDNEYYKWLDYCKNLNSFHGIKPIPTAALTDMRPDVDISYKIQANELEGSFPIGKTGCVPFSYELSQKNQSGDIIQPKIKKYIGKYILRGIPSKENTENTPTKWRFDDNYIWRSMTSLPILHADKLGTEQHVSEIFNKEPNTKNPTPSYINLLPLIKS